MDLATWTVNEARSMDLGGFDLALSRSCGQRLRRMIELYEEGGFWNGVRSKPLKDSFDNRNSTETTI